MDRNLYRNMALIVAVFILVFGVGTASAQHAAKSKSDNSGAAAGDNSQQVAIDGKGNLRGLSKEEAAALADGMVKSNNTSSEGLKPFTVANGMTGYDLEGRFENSEIVKINPDGTLSQACVRSREEAKKFLTADPKNESQAKPEQAKPQAKPQPELETK